MKIQHGIGGRPWQQLVRGLRLATIGFGTAIGLGTIGFGVAVGRAADQPIAIFHAHDQRYDEVAGFVCALSQQGYSHVQIAPTQKSNPDPAWWARYQPIDYSVIEGRGTESDLQTLITAAHRCHVKVIADVVFNHMANMPEYQSLRFPQFGPEDFQARCNTNYDDPAQKWTLHRCWLGDLPDLDVTRPHVQAVQKAHLQKLLDLGVDGFRFDAAKHMPQSAIQEYLNVANTRDTWNYLEVIEDNSTKGEEYNGLAAITDFRLYNTMRTAFSFGGDLRSLRVPNALNDARSVVFGRNHDTAPDITGSAINPYADAMDAHLATAYVLARQAGTPLVLNRDNYAIPFIKYGVKFRRILQERSQEGKNVRESVLAAIESPTLLLMQRGSEGFFVANKAAAKVDIPVLDLTLSDLEGCYVELRNNFTVAIERRDQGKKYVTRWGSWNRGGMEVQGRDALYFVRGPWSQCQPNPRSTVGQP